jgi:hypothetical protein
MKSVLDLISEIKKCEALKGHEDQPYKYRGLDVYGARCAVLHAFGTEVDFHNKTPMRGDLAITTAASTRMTRYRRASGDYRNRVVLE